MCTQNCDNILSLLMLNGLNESKLRLGASSSRVNPNCIYCLTRWQNSGRLTSTWKRADIGQQIYRSGPAKYISKLVSMQAVTLSSLYACARR